MLIALSKGMKGLLHFSIGILLFLSGPSLSLADLCQVDPHAEASHAALLLKSFLTDHSAEGLTRLELIHIRHGKGIGSMWGHILIAFHFAQTAEGGEISEKSFALGVTVPEDQGSHLEMLLGTLPVEIQFGFLDSFKKRYLKEQRRPWVRYELDLEKIDEQALWKLLRVRAEDPDFFGNYSFLNKNCATIPVGLIRASANEGLHGPQPLSPWRSPKYLEKNGLIRSKRVELP